MQRRVALFRFVPIAVLGILFVVGDLVATIAIENAGDEEAGIILTVGLARHLGQLGAKPTSGMVDCRDFLLRCRYTCRDHRLRCGLRPEQR